jgi:hypothetical protein
MKTAAIICLVLGLMTFYASFGPDRRPFSLNPAARAGELTVALGLPAVFFIASGVLFAKVRRRGRRT